MKLNTDSLTALSTILPVVGDFNFVLIGCGGTGSWLAPHIVRIAKILQDVHDQKISLTFWDDDLVEEKNIYRQNFCAAEIGENKAETLAGRYGQAWEMEITAINKRFTGLQNMNTYPYGRSVFVGCVDNNLTRQAIHNAAMRYPVWWLDAGNTKTAGQVCIGRWLEEDDRPFSLVSRTTWLPMPSLQFPIMLEKEKPRVDLEFDLNELSCAEMVMLDEQGFSINQMVASTAATILSNMFLSGELTYHCAHVSLEHGTQVIYNTPKVLRKYIRMIKEMRKETR
jgi:PRTRC genetic system ThiF family protein